MCENASRFAFKTAALDQSNLKMVTLKAHQMFSVHSIPEKFENPTIAGHFVFALSNIGQGNIMIIVASSNSKSLFSKCFLSAFERKAGVFKDYCGR